ncbi:MAG: hypothetical protein ACREJN_07705 [Nitrospiraceae bacterium]
MLLWLGFSAPVLGMATGISSVSTIFRMLYSTDMNKSGRVKGPALAGEFWAGISHFSQRCVLFSRKVAPYRKSLRVVETGGSIEYHDGLDWLCKDSADALGNPLIQEDNSDEFIFKNNGIA